MTTTPYAQGVPGPQLTTPDGQVLGNWYSFFLSLWSRTGGASGSPSIIIDGIANSPGDILYRATNAWQALGPGAKYRVLRMGAQFPEWDVLDGNSFGSRAGSLFFVSPAGTTGIPAFRSIVTADLVPVEGQFPGTTTNDLANAGNVGEYLSATGSAVTMSSGGVADIASILLSPGDWDVWGNFASIPASGITITGLNAWINTASATDPGTPNAGAYAQLAGTFTLSQTQTVAVGQTRIQVAASSTKTAYLSASTTFSAGTATAAGFIAARRVR